MSNKSRITLGEPTTEKEYVSQPENGVGFEFGKSVIDLKTQQNLIRYFDKIKHEIVGTQNKVIIRGYASHPGKNSFNRNLSLKRAKSLRTWLIDQGVDSERISVIPMGEWAIEPGIDEPENPETEYDVAENRSAIIEIEYSSVPVPIPEKKEEVKDESELTELRNERFPDNFDQDWSDGKELFQKLVEPEADLIRRDIALPENPIMASPSDNPEKLQEQIWGIVKGGRKINPLGVAKVLGKGVLGSFIDLAISNSAGDVADQRYDMYQALSIAVAAGIDENYVPDLKNMTDVQRALYDHLLPKVEKLSTKEMHAIQVYLIAKNPGSAFYKNRTQHSERALDEFFSGYTIQSGAEKAFNASDYRYKSSYDESGLYFIENNGVLIIQSWGDLVNDVNQQVSEMIKAAAEVTGQSDNGVISQPSDSIPIQNPFGSDEDNFDSNSSSDVDKSEEHIAAPATDQTGNDIITQPSDSFATQNPWGSDEDDFDSNSSSDHADAKVTTAESDMDYPDPGEPTEMFSEHDKDSEENEDGEGNRNVEEGEDGEDEKNYEHGVVEESKDSIDSDDDEPPSPPASSDAANAENTADAPDAPDAPA